jgi:xylulose-5-phosphate/fructose-6-phosphate phosphoketolase
VTTLDETTTTTLPPDELELLDAWWRAANYLSVGQIYLLDNPLLRRPLVREDIKPRLLGHWGTTPGLNLLWAHVNRLIRQRDVNAIFLAGPGHGGPAAVANAWLEGTYTEVYPHIGSDEAGMQRLFRQFSFPGGIPSHVAPETPGSIHEGGELGYVLSHAYGAAMDNPDLLVAAVVGDGEFETGPLAASWHANKFVDPVADGAVLPILHLNGYKIANPTVPARIPRHELESLLQGYGHEVIFVEGDDPQDVHQQLAAALDSAHDTIREIQRAAREDGDVERRPWPMIVLVTPKGWTGPRDVDGVRIEGTWRAHQVPLANTREDDDHRGLLEAWMRSYRPEELFEDDGRLAARLRDLSPTGTRRMSANPHANGGLLRRPLVLRDHGEHTVEVTAPGASIHEPTRVLGYYLTDVMRDNTDNFRIFGPDETASNRLDAVYEVTNKVFAGDPLRAHLPGLARGLPAHRPAWPVQLLRGVHPHHRRDGQPARQVAEDDAEHRVAPTDRLAQLPADLARVAAGPQRLLPPGPRLHRPRRQQEGRGRPRLPAAGHQHPALDDAALPGEHALRQRRGGREATGLRLAGRGHRRPSLRPRPGHLGLGLERRRRPGRSDRVRRRHPDPGVARRGADPA